MQRVGDREKNTSFAEMDVEIIHRLNDFSNNLMHERGRPIRACSPVFFLKKKIISFEERREEDSRRVSFAVFTSPYTTDLRTLYEKGEGSFGDLIVRVRLQAPCFLTPAGGWGCWLSQSRKQTESGRS